MSVGILRRAAALARERAGAATPGPWTATRVGLLGGVTGLVIHQAEDRKRFVLCDTDPCANADDAKFIASWHPAVALAVADWLDAVADDFDIAQYGYWSERALAVARAYLGEEADRD